MDMYKQIDIEFNDTTYIVSYTFEAGDPGDYYTAPEGPSVDVVDIVPHADLDIEQYVFIIEQIIEQETINN